MGAKVQIFAEKALFIGTFFIKDNKKGFWCVNNSVLIQ
jgi:hypothetical protein